MNEEYRERMYRVLDLYAQPYDPQYPVINMDEKSKQLIDDTRPRLPCKQGASVKIDAEYRRRGTVNIFVAVEPKAGKRVVQVTKRRTKQDFAFFIARLIDTKEYRRAKKIRIVLDNLNTHFPSSLHATFSETEANRILKRIAFIHTPKHASWLNMAEIEIGVLDRQCLNRRIGDRAFLQQEVMRWERRRNAKRATIRWTFTKQKADEKLSRHYV